MSAPTTPIPPDDAEATPDQDPAADAPSGWRRVLIGLLIGLAAGVLLALILPRRPRPEEDPVPDPSEVAGRAAAEPGPPPVDDDDAPPR